MAAAATLLVAAVLVIGRPSPSALLQTFSSATGWTVYPQNMLPVSKTAAQSYSSSGWQMQPEVVQSQDEQQHVLVLPVPRSGTGSARAQGWAEGAPRPAPQS